MSLFNFNPSSFLGSGAFALDPSKFNFSNINVPSTTPDPLDIVAPEPVQPEQTGMLSPEPQYSQALLDAQEGLLGVDLSDSFNVNPVQGLDLSVPEEPAPEPVNVTSQPVQSNPVIPQQPTSVIGDSSLASGFDVSQSSIVNMFNQDMTNRNLLEPLLEDYDKFQVSQGDRGLIEDDIAKDLMSFVTTDDFNNLVNQYSQLRVGEQTGNQTVQQMASREVLDALGIPNLFETKDDKGRSSVYQFNTDTNEFDLVRQYGGTDAVGEFVEAAAPALLVTAATAGLGGALAGSLGVGGSAVGTGVTNALVNAGLQQAITGDVDWGDALTSGFSAGVGAYADSVKTAQEVSNNLKTIVETGNAGEAAIAATQLANATQKAAEMTSTLDVLNNIQTGIDIVEAVENDNFLEAFDLGATLLGSDSMNSLVKSKIGDVVPKQFQDPFAEAVIKSADTALQGGDVGQVLQDATNEFLINTVATESRMSEVFGLGDDGYSPAIASTLASMTQEVLEGGNREDILLSGAEAFYDNLPESEREGVDFSSIENWWHENIEDPLEAYWQEIEPYREMVEQAGQSAINTVKNVSENVIEGLDGIVRALPTTKEDWENFENDVKENVVDPTVTAVRETGRGVREAVDPVANVVREAGREVEEIYDTAEDFVKEDVAPIVREFGRNIRNSIPDVPSVDLPSIDVPSIDLDVDFSNRRTEYIYDDSDILRNKLLNSDFTSVRDLSDLEVLETEEVTPEVVDNRKDRVKRSKPVYGVNAKIKVG